MVGMLAMASAICFRLWFIMADIRSALNDPMTMAVIITEDSIKADNKKAEGMLEGARIGFADTEKIVGLFSVALILIAVALTVRVVKRRNDARKVPGTSGQPTKGKRQPRR